MGSFFLQLIFLFFFYVLQYQGGLVVGYEKVDHNNEGTTIKCSTNGPTIRFPFWLKDHHQQQKHDNSCRGPPAFSLSCSPTNLTMLTNLPFSSSSSVFVSEINYTSRSIRIDHNPPSVVCSQSLNLSESSSSPFRLGTTYPYSSWMWYVLYSCPKKKNFSMINGDYSAREIQCLSSPSHTVIACPRKDQVLNYLYDIRNCTRMFHHELSELVVDALTHSPKWTWSEPAHCRKNETIYYLITGVSLAVLVVLVSLYFIYRTKKAKKDDQIMIARFLEDYKALKPTRYTYAEITRITNNFIDKLGQGGYGTVYKGKLSNDVLVAAKILKNSNGNGQDEFLNEVATIGTIHHVNVVRLVGYCADGFRRALVYEYLPNDSLEKFISSPDQRKRSIGWDKFQEIALGIAKGIEYLHQGCNQQILHFDIKPHNILLDENFNPKVADFGLAKLCSKDQSAISMTIARGTIGYIAPEVISRNFGRVSHKSDVYSFGMLLLEMAGGRKNPEIREENGSEVYFPEWIYNHLNDNTERVTIEIEDNQGGEKIVKKLMTVGLWCIQWTPEDRPSIKTVVQMLEGDGDTLPMPPNPFVTKNSATGGLLNSLEVISEYESESLD